MIAVDAVEQSNEAIVTFSLVELLTQLVFVAMALALVLQQETETRMTPTAERLRQLEAQIAARDRVIEAQRRDLATLRRAVAAQAEFIGKLKQLPRNHLPSEAGIWVGKDSFARMAAADAFNSDLRGQNAGLRARLEAKTGTVIRAQCDMTPGPLLSIRLLASGDVAARPAWPAGSDDRARRIPGVAALAAAPSLGRARFGVLARPVKSAGRAASPECDFLVRTELGHNDARLAQRQLAMLEQYFRVRAPR